MQIALSQVKDVSEVLAKLLDGGQSKVAGRMSGAFRATGRTGDVDRILKTMRSVGYVVAEQNPFDAPVSASTRETGLPPEVRARLIWERMRDDVIATFPSPPGLPAEIEPYIADLNDRQVKDAYHSLSIEGYQVSDELIAKIAAGDWHPEVNESGVQDKNALAAKGYHDAFEKVRTSVGRILSHEEPGAVIRHDHHDWYMRHFWSSSQSRLS